MTTYDIAFSFTGENRPFVETIKNELIKNGFNVFYDNDYKAELWGADLTVELPIKYQSARYVALFLDEYYLNKMWTFFERQVIIEKYLSEHGAQYMLPIRLNGFNQPVPGISGLIGYLNINTETDKDILVELFLQKLNTK